MDILSQVMGWADAMLDDGASYQRDLMELLFATYSKDFDIAISKEGKEDLLRSLKIALVDGTEFMLNLDGNFRKCVETAWIGEDRDKYLESFDRQREETKKRVLEHYKKLEAQLNKVDEEWEAFRASNVVAE